MSTDPKDKGDSEKAAPKYRAERVIGNGSFGIVYQAVKTDDNTVTVAIKKVFQDRRYKNRELQVMKLFQKARHPNVVYLEDCFYSRGNRGRDVYLNLVMEYVPETVYQTIRSHSRAHHTIPYIFSKIYAFQMCRAVSHTHAMGVCHRDIKPQNLLLNPATHTVKLCDFGSAKLLVKGEPNVAYICSRYYRAPELVFEASDYTTAIDIWSLGCVIAELFLGTPLFQGDSGVDQLVEIIKVLGAPSKTDILAMNKNYTQHRFPQVKPLKWEVVFASVKYDDKPVEASAIDLIKKFLVFQPLNRPLPFDALKHEFFDELRKRDAVLPNGNPIPNIFDFVPDETAYLDKVGRENVMPAHMVDDYKEDS